MTLLSQLQPHSALPLEFLVPQMLCFAFQAAPNGTKEQKEFMQYQNQLEQLEKQLEDGVQKNRQLTELSKNLQEQLHNASWKSREIYDNMTQLHRAATIRKQHLQEKKIQLQQQMNSPRIKLLDQILKLKEYQDQCKLTFNDVKQHKVSLLQETVDRNNDLKAATGNTNNLKRELNKKQQQISAAKRQIQQLKKEIQVKMATASAITNNRKVTTAPPTQKPLVQSEEELLKENIKNELSQKSENEREALVGQAAAEGNLTVLQVLADLGTELSTTDQYGLQPLDWAALTGDIDVAKTLINAGANLSSKNDEGDTPLHWAARKGQLQLVQLFVKAGAELDAKNNIGSTPLHEAVFYGHKDIVRLLIEEHADVNIGNGELNTPLHFAAHNGNLQIVQLLEEQGADLKAINKAGKTPQQEADNAGKKDVAEWLANQ